MSIHILGPPMARGTLTRVLLGFGILQDADLYIRALGKVVIYGEAVKSWELRGHKPRVTYGG